MLEYYSHVVIKMLTFFREWPLMQVNKSEAHIWKSWNRKQNYDIFSGRQYTPVVHYVPTAGNEK